MINTSNMIKASDLKVGDKVCSVNGVEYEVITNLMNFDYDEIGNLKESI